MRNMKECNINMNNLWCVHKGYNSEPVRCIAIIAKQEPTDYVAQTNPYLRLLVIDYNDELDEIEDTLNSFKFYKDYPRA